VWIKLYLKILKNKLNQNYRVIFITILVLNQFDIGKKNVLYKYNAYASSVRTYTLNIFQKKFKLKYNYNSKTKIWLKFYNALIKYYVSLDSGLVIFTVVLNFNYLQR